jgi:starch-binding outer membrane protein, SusD/RagB family
MKKILYSLIAVFIISTSCEDMLDKKPLNIISDGVVWEDETLIDAYLTEIYGEMVFFVNDLYGNSMYTPIFLAKNWFDMCMTINICDEATDAWVYSGWKYNQLTDAGGLYELWTYDLIRKQNVFLEQMEDANVNEAFKKQKIAENRFLRAFTYFSMVKRYGGVPLITKAQKLTDPEDELYPKRNKEAEIYDFIISEVDDIVNDLPENYDASDFGRPTRYAALALKSRAAMYAGSIATWGQYNLNGLAGIQSTQAESYWQQSYNASKAIIESGKYALYSDYQYIFLDENNEEVIFSKLFNGPGGLGMKGHGWDLYQCPRGYNPWGGGNQSSVYLDMVESYEYIDGTPGTLDRTELESKLWTMDELWKDKDPRFKASVYTQGTPWMNNELQFYNGIMVDGNIITSGSYNGVLAKGISNNDRTSFGVLKYLIPTYEQPDNNASPTDWIVFRYGEILLNFAEAAFELGNTDEALNAVNQIRERAEIATLNSIDRDKIRHERRIELAFENHRFWDLRRWRIAHIELSRNFSGLRYILDYETKKFRVEVIDAHGTVLPNFNQNKYYFPIGRNRIANNPNLIENPGY